MASLEALAKLWHKNKVLIVMGGLLTGSHMAWRWVQDQDEFVPKKNDYGWAPKEYPWFEAAKHIQEARNNTANEVKGSK